MKDKITVILAAGGSGERAKQGKNKILTEIDGTACIKKTFDAFYASGLIAEYVVAARREDAEEIKSVLPAFVKMVNGGKTRTESVKNALKATTGEIVLIHDAARPFVSERIIKDCIDSAKSNGSGVAAIPSRDTVVKKDGATEYLGKSGLYLIQTPQAFKTEEIKTAYEKAGDKTFNDDGEAYLNCFKKLDLVAGDKNNIKLTYPEDFSGAKKETRFGTGFDCHRLTEGRRLILGGVEIPFNKGLLGHSDADVLTHAVMDAILSACCLRDIGYWFPDSDEKYKDADSLKLLAEVLRIVGEKGFKTESVSAVIMAEKPKLLKFIPKISESLANALNLSPDKVGISATTLEGLGFVGREEGICVHANAVVVK